MTSTSVLVEQTRVDYLQGGLSDQRNLLSIGINDTDTTIVLTYPTGAIAPNSRISIGLEDIHVYQVDQSTRTLTVSRGDYGSTAASHSAGDVILAGSLNSNNQILSAFNDTLLELEGRGLYAVDITELLFLTGTLTYDLSGTDGLLSIVDVATRSSTSDDWHRLDVSEWWVMQSAETDDFASGKGIVLHRDESAYTGEQLRVWYRKSFTPFTDMTGEGTDSGLDVGAEDLLKLGAAIRLSASTPMLRNHLVAQPDLRRADEVPPGATIAAPSNLRRIYERRIQDELHRLSARYPVRLRGAK